MASYARGPRWGAADVTFGVSPALSAGIVAGEVGWKIPFRGIRGCGTDLRSSGRDGLNPGIRGPLQLGALGGVRGMQKNSGAIS